MAEKKKLFGNVGGNSFKLLTEGMEVTADRPQGTEHIREGLKKVLANGGSEISYTRLSYVGLGYIKDVTIAAKCAIREARELAEEFGYKDDQHNEKFVKENDIESEPFTPGKKHDETDMSNPEEKREVQIGKEIIELCKGYDDNFPKIQALAQELIDMHSK